MYIFNPEHDLCLANGDRNFVPPGSALKFGKDCSGLTNFMVGLVPESEDTVDGEFEYGEYGRIGSIVPWGWNRALKCKLIKAGVSEMLLPADKDLDEIRELSNRKYAIQALKYIISRFPNYTWPGDHIVAENIDAILRYINDIPFAVLKMPLSGSGKGIRWIGRRNSTLSDSDLGWCKNTLKRQGTVIISPRYKVVQDFAMLFKCTGNADSSASKRGGAQFFGYSLFHTDNGCYTGNTLASNEYIENFLTEMICREQLGSIKTAIIEFLELNYVGKYVGFIGVDMFIYERNKDYFIHPAVEINVRMTMGLLARHIFDFYMMKRDVSHCPLLFKYADVYGDNGKDGDNYDANIYGFDGKYRMSVVYCAEKGKLFKDFCNAISLCKINESTEYGVIITANHDVSQISGNE